GSDGGGGNGGGARARRAAAAGAGVERGAALPPRALRAAAGRRAGRAGVGAAGPQRAVLGGGARPVLVLCSDFPSFAVPDCCNPHSGSVCRPVETQNLARNWCWGYVHPRLLGLPELCHHLAEGWVTGTNFLNNLFVFKRQSPGKFCLLVCGVFTFLAVLGRYIPGLLLSYLLLLLVLLWPLAVYHRLRQRLYLRLEPVLRRLDFSVRGYVTARQRQRQLHGRALGEEATDDGSDSEEELAAFCPKLDDSVVAKELTISDSEHSDAEVSYTENGMFNLSRGQTPLTEGSEDLDGHSDPEESFARDLPDFPSINPEATGIDDEDDTSIGIPSLAYRPQGTEDLQLPYEQEEFGTLPSVQNLTNNIAGFVTRGMIQLALSGGSQAGPSRSTNPQRGAKTHLRAASLDLDTDAEGDDFELLDQSELNQLDPTGSRGQ
uniref:Reticulophagy regulator family member 3 n=1 Tax=Zonotrichia albicollis TaxID=44394 RepID=A0A8D2QBX8_ZONAL